MSLAAVIFNKTTSESTRNKNELMSQTLDKSMQLISILMSQFYLQVPMPYLSLLPLYWTHNGLKFLLPIEAHHGSTYQSLMQ